MRMSSAASLASSSNFWRILSASDCCGDWRGRMLGRDDTWQVATGDSWRPVGAGEAERHEAEAERLCAVLYLDSRS
jgi:hypothetical protein